MKEGIDVQVYKVTMSVAPMANRYTLHFADSAPKKVVKSWHVVAPGRPSAAAKPT